MLQLTDEKKCRIISEMTQVIGSPATEQGDVMRQQGGQIRGRVLHQNTRVATPYCDGAVGGGKTVCELGREAR